MSVDNGDMVSAEESFRSFTERFESAGVLAVTVAECQAQELQVVPDSQLDRSAHTVIDFSGLSGGKTKKAAERLRDDAVPARLAVSTVSDFLTSSLGSGGPPRGCPGRGAALTDYGRVVRGDADKVLGDWAEDLCRPPWPEAAPEGSLPGRRTE